MQRRVWLYDGFRAAQILAAMIQYHLREQIPYEHLDPGWCSISAQAQGDSAICEVIFFVPHRHIDFTLQLYCVVACEKAAWSQAIVQAQAVRGSFRKSLGQFRCRRLDQTKPLVLFKGLS